MHMRMRTFRDQTAGFSGAVMRPGSGLQEIERGGPEISVVEAVPQSAQLRPSNPGTALLLLISELGPLSAELKLKQSQFLGELSELVNRLETELLDPANTERIENLTEAYRAVREQGREGQKECAALEIEFGRSTSEWNAARAKKEQNIEAVRVANYQRDHLDRFASDTQIAEAEHKIAAAKEKAGKAVSAEAAALHARNQAEEKLLAARRELALLAQGETRLSAAIEGRQIRDPEFGLSPTPGNAA